jgi:hypothetical protein
MADKSTPQKKQKKLRLLLGRKKLWCTYCCIFFSENLRGHSCPKLSKRKLTAAEIVRVEQENAVLRDQAMSKVYFSLRDFYQKATYSQPEVLGILASFGHFLVPDREEIDHRSETDSSISTPAVVQIEAPGREEVNPSDSEDRVENNSNSGPEEEEANDGAEEITYAENKTNSKDLVSNEATASEEKANESAVDIPSDVMTSDSSKRKLDFRLKDHPLHIHLGKERNKIVIDSHTESVSINTSEQDRCMQRVTTPLERISDVENTVNSKPNKRVRFSDTSDDSVPLASYKRKLSDSGSSDDIPLSKIAKRKSTRNQVSNTSNTSDSTSSISWASLSDRPRRSNTRLPVVDDGETNDDEMDDIDYLPKMNKTKSSPGSKSREAQRRLRLKTTSLQDNSTSSSIQVANMVKMRYKKIAHANGASHRSSKAYAYTKKGVKSNSTRSGMYDHRGFYDDYTIFKEFDRYLQDILAKEENTSSQFVSRAKMFMWHANRCDTDDTNPACEITVITAKSIEAFKKQMYDTGHVHSSVKAYLLSITEFVTYLTTFRSEDMSPTTKSNLKELPAFLAKVIKGVGRKASSDIQKARATEPSRLNPQPPSKVAHIVKKGRDKAEALIKKCIDRNRVNRDDFTSINGYLGAYICLKNAQRPGLAYNMTLDEFQSARETDHDGKVYHTIMVAEHKTATTQMGLLAIESDIFQMFRDYTKVRNILLTSLDKTSRYYFVNNNGKKANQSIGANIKALQAHANVRAFTSRESRRSYESWGQNSEKYVRQTAHYIAHSEDMAKRRYIACNPQMAAKAASQMGQLLNFCEDKTTDHDLPTETELGHLFTGSTNDTDAISPNARKSRPTRSTNVGMKANLTGLKSPKSLKSFKGLRSPKSPSLKKEEIVSELLKRHEPINKVTKFPPASKIMNEFGIPKPLADRIWESLRTEKRRIVTEAYADDLLGINQRGKHNKSVYTSDLRDLCPEQLPKRGDVQIQKNIFTVLKKRAKKLAAEARLYIGIDDRKAIATHIKLQDWPNIGICQTKSMGRGVQTKGEWIKKGSVVCDYHGHLMSRAEGETIRKAIHPRELSNYMYFFQHDSKRLCVDASNIPCRCHKEHKGTETMGRLINHSTDPNLCTKKFQGDDKIHLLLVAKKDISPCTQIFFDYGVKKDDEGGSLFAV